MGLLSSSNKSSNTTVNNVDNSVLTVAEDAIGISGDNNRVTVTDGGAFDLVINATEELIKGSNENIELFADGFGSMADKMADIASDGISASTEGQKILADATVESLDLFLNSSDNNTQLSIESSASTAALALENSSDLSALAMDNNFDLASLALNSNADVTSESYELVGKSIEAIVGAQDSAYDFSDSISGRAFDSMDANTTKALDAVADSNARVTEHYEDIARISSGDNSQIMNKIIMAAMGLGALFAVTKMVRG